MKQYLSALCLGIWLCAVMASSPARAVLIPQPLATDPRIKVVSYAPNEVIKYTGYYRVQTSWEFEEGEEISTISMGDSMAWMLNPLGNRLFIKPVEEDATTNMTIITNKRTYLFELHAAHTDKIDDKDVTWVLRFIYPESEATLAVSSIDQVPDLDGEDLSKYNFRYTITGSEDVSPIRIFDDGEFTYFEFRDKNGEVPAFYQVDASGNESLINYRTRGPYIVVERVAARFTLRHGGSVVCVFNEAMSVGGKGKKGGKSSSSQSASSSSSAPASAATWQK